MIFNELDYPVPQKVPHIKICGLKRPQDAGLALELGASFLGLILTEKSPRHLPAAEARELVAEVRRRFGEQVRFIGVFVDEDPAEVVRLYEELGLFAIQAHRNVEQLSELLPPQRVIPALAIRDEADAARADEFRSNHTALHADAFSPTAHGGTGKVFDHRFVQPYFARTRVLIAGGLNPENIEEILFRLTPGGLPYAFDLSSGIEESPGVKSERKMRRFFEEFHRALGGSFQP